MTDEFKQYNKESNHTCETKSLSNPYQALFEYSNDSIIIHDLEGRIIEVNRKTEEIFGKTKEELSKGYIRDLPKKDGKETCRKHLEILKKRGFIRFECNFIGKNSIGFPVEVSSSLIEIDGHTLVQAIIRDLSSEKKTLERLTKTKEQYQTLFDNTAFGALIIENSSLELLRCNKMAADMLDIDIHNLKAWDIEVLHHQLTKEEYQTHFDEVAQNNSHSYSTSVTDKHGKHRELLISCREVHFEEKVCHLSILVDITEKKNYQQELEKINIQLQKSKLDLIEAQKIAQVGNWELNLITNQLTWSDEVYRIFDLEVHEFEANYQAFLDNIHPEDKKRVNRAYLKSVENKEPYHIVHRIITKNGILKYVEERCEHILDEQQNIIRSIGTIQDITRHKKTKLELRKSQKNYQSILENMQDTYYRSNINGELILLSGGVETLLGYRKDELIGEKLISLYRYPLLRESLLQGLKDNGGKYTLEAELIHKNQHFIWVSTKSQYWYTDEGEVGGIEGFVRDITAEKLAQIKERTLLNLIDASSNEIYVFDKKSLCFNYINQGGVNNLKYTLSELLTMHPYDIKPDFNERDFRDYVQPLIDKRAKQQKFKTTHQRKDGSTYPVQIHLQLLEENFLAVIMDITEQESMNQKMQEQEEMMLVQSRHAAMGEMISMIAHQWRQPISIVGMLATTIMQDVKRNRINHDAMQEDLKNINNQVQYMSKTINDFRNFFQKSNAIDEVNLYQMLMESNNILGAVLRRHNIQLTINCKTSIVLYTYSRELVQVIINILSNAKDALGKVTDRKDIYINVTEKEQEVEISIFNNGLPIEESIKNKIFEPYFTTKGNLGGTGLGLYMVKSILDKHMHGKITVENREDGVAFNITLPKNLKTI